MVALFDDLELHAPVGFAGLAIASLYRRFVFPIAFGTKPVGRHPLANKVLHYRVCSFLGQAKVLVGSAPVIGVASNFDLGDVRVTCDDLLPARRDDWRRPDNSRRANR